MGWTVDNVYFDLPCNIEREAEVRPSEISGMMLNKTYFNDVLGTYMKYKITVAIPRGMEEQYAELYEILTSAQGHHSFNLPYNYTEEGINITGMIQNVSDTYVRLPQGKQTWRRTSFDIISSAPTKVPDGTEYGMAVMPEDTEAEEGSLWQKESYGWVQRFYDDADEKEY